MPSLETRHFPYKGQSRPALDRCWVKDIGFIPYNPPCSTSTTDRIDSWLTSSEIVVDDLSWLLEQSCHIFWSHLIFDDSLRACLDSFLRLAPRDFDGRIYDSRIDSRIKELHSVFFRAFIRMTTCKESNEDFLDSAVFGTILYDNFILDIPKIIDLCTLFGGSNEKLLVKMIDNVFRHQPKYLEDVNAALPSIAKMFQDMIERLTDNKLTQPRELSAPNPESSIADIDMSDLCSYAADMCHSLYMFLHIHPRASQSFHQTQFYKTICLYYDDVLWRLEEQVIAATDLGENDEKKAYKKLQVAKEESIKLFRQILFTCTLEKALNNRELVRSCIQDYYDILSEYLGEARFMSQYATLFSFSDDLDIISQLDPNSDSTRQSFIRDGLISAQSVMQQTQESISLHPSQVSDEETEELQGASAAGAASGAAAEPNLLTSSSSAVQSVKDMFPDLGSGFIQMCMRQYQSVDEVIHALLEENLPPSLAKLDRTLSQPIEEVTLVTTRKNVFDNDEFDIFRNQAVDTSKMHKGKRGYNLREADHNYKDKIKSLASNMEAMEIAKAMGVHVSEVNKTPELTGDITTAFNQGLYSTADMYDDEYDDTYDANEVGAADADEALDLMGRTMVVPIALGGSGKLEEDEEDPLPQNGNTQPAGQSQDNQRPKYDVKGRAKGQGQSADVIKNRNFKTAHKARGANHNRKAGARSKLSKGMF